MGNKRSSRGWLNIALLWIFISLVYYFGIIRIISIEFIIEQRESFHYNAISLSSIIAGFLFTGISILLSVIDKPRIERLWNYGYLNNLYRASIIGIAFNVVTVMLALCFTTIRVKGNLQCALLYIELYSIILGLTFFIWSVKQLIYVIKKTKKDS